jgi:hypothetical protein
MASIREKQGKAVPDVEPLRSVHTSNLPGLFEQLRISLVVSTYQAGKIILIRNDGGVLNTHFRGFVKPMGIAAVPTHVLYCNLLINIAARQELVRQNISSFYNSLKI